MLSSVTIFAQTSDKPVLDNIVPNPGFEKYSATPIGWFLKGAHFTNVIRYWESPTTASPDIFGPKVRVPMHWKEKGFGEQAVHKGKSMAGITVYGCTNGKPHCREYIQIQLEEALVIGQRYYAEFWVSNLPRGMAIDNVGMLFSEKRYQVKTDELIDETPQVKADYIVQSANNSWAKISSSFIAKTEAEYLIIGNFSKDEDTQMRKGKVPQLNFAYYYVDDVLLKKQEPILSVPVKANDLTNIEVEAGKVVALKNIYFEHDKTELLPRSFEELNKLYSLLQMHPSMVIEVIGHTDNSGEEGYNLRLSMDRAAAVVSYLEGKGIATSRLFFKGNGQINPVASNETADGRQQNRRVEFVILEK